MRKPLLTLLLLAGSLGSLPAVDLDVEIGNRPYAPLDIKQQKTVSASLSRSERRELSQEFRGLLAMGQRSYGFEKWSGRPMADCYKPERPGERWKHKCEIITGQGNGFYFFYDMTSREPTLQQVEVFMQTSDEALIEELKPVVRHLFGQREILVRERPGTKAIGPIRHWNTGEQTADLFLDATQSPNGTVHFVWSRGPLASTRQAKAP